MLQKFKKKMYQFQFYDRAKKEDVIIFVPHLKCLSLNLEWKKVVFKLKSSNLENIVSFRAKVMMEKDNIWFLGMMLKFSINGD